MQKMKKLTVYYRIEKLESTIFTTKGGFFTSFRNHKTYEEM